MWLWISTLSRRFMQGLAVMHSGTSTPLTRSRTHGARNAPNRQGGPSRLRDQHSHIRGGRMLLPQRWRHLPDESPVRSGRRTVRYAIDPSSPLQGLQTPTPAQSLDLQILQRTLQVLSLSVLSTVRLCCKSLMFTTTSHSVVVWYYPCIGLVV